MTPSMVGVFERITLRAIRAPQLRLGKEETLASYHERVSIDVKRRPKYYVIDTNYYRNEFDLDAVKIRAKRVAEDIRRYLEWCDSKESFFQTIGPSTCFMSSPCPYISICESGVISPIIYSRREAKEHASSSGGH